ncbi:MAG: flagellar biosynthesis protein FlhF [Planctomycetes bacterium]|nr:flagellar biosynthesis protein FlhF [Planctomycetota bacterium]
MGVKTFTAATWEDALAAVKRELGESAVILSSTSVPDKEQGGKVSITATNDADEVAKAGGRTSLGRLEERTRAGYARLVQRAYALGADRAPEPARPGQPANPENLRRDVDELKELVRRLAERTEAGAVADYPDTVKAVWRRLEAADVAPELARRFCNDVLRNLSGSQLEHEETVLQAALQTLAGAIQVAGPVTLSAGRTRTVAFVGPTGVGKTTTLSKLAANFKLRDRATVGFITVDTYRLGATEQLKTLAGILEVPVRIVMTPGEIRSAMAELRDRDIVFIDTAGRSPRDQLRINELRAFLDAAQPDETHLVVSATTHPRHLDSLLERFGGEAIHKLVLTKLDEAASYGPALDVILGAGKPLSYITTGQDIPDDIEVADRMRIARLMLGLDELTR